MYILNPLHGNSSDAGQQMLQLVFPGLDHYLNFLRAPWNCCHPQTTESSLPNTMPTFPRGMVSGFCHSVSSECLSLFMGDTG